MCHEEVGYFLGRRFVRQLILNLQAAITLPVFPNGINHLRANRIARPRDVLSGLATVFSVGHRSLKDLVRLERGAIVFLGLTNGDAAVTLGRKRHRHRGHDAAEAQRCCEAGGYCQACDVLAHAHLLFLRFPFDSHSIGHHLSVS